MRAGRKTQTFHVSRTQPISSSSLKSYTSRNLEKCELGGVIFGCINSTMKECLTKQLFGLPARHFSYVKNINPGLPVFLFNYSDRNLYGIFEASSKGQMYIDPHAWTGDPSKRTQYPAQVQLRVRLQCQPLPEDKFGKIIADNYYTNNHFLFELDHRQASKLLYLLATLAIAPGTRVPRYDMKQRIVAPCLPSYETLEEALETHESDWETDSSDIASSFDGDIQPLDTNTVEKEVDENEKKEDTRELALTRELLDNRNDTPNEEKKEDSSSPPFEDLYTIFKLIQLVGELRAFKATETQKNGYLEQKLMKTKLEIQHLKNRCTMLECTRVEKINTQSSSVELPLDPKESLSLKGEIDGESWLTDLDLCFHSHSQNSIKYLKPISYVRLYTSIVQMNGGHYVYGGGNDCLWYDTVESYRSLEKHTLCPFLYKKKESSVEITLNNKLFEVGGINGFNCFLNVEMLDLNNGKWTSILDKRFDHAAVKLNSSLYASCGYSGFDYLKYALGGFHECTMVLSIKLYDLCLGSRMVVELMNQLVKEPILIEGVKVDVNMVDTFSEAIKIIYGNNDESRQNDYSDVTAYR